MITTSAQGTSTAMWTICMKKTSFLKKEKRKIRSLRITETAKQYEQHMICGLWRQKQVSQAMMNNHIPQNIVVCNYLSMPEIPASGAKVLIWWYWHETHARGTYSFKQRTYDDLFLLTTNTSWWRHQMETFSALLAICAGNSPVPGEFPTQRPVTRSFDVYFDRRPDNRLSKQSWGWWFETLSHSLWRHRNVPFNRKCTIQLRQISYTLHIMPVSQLYRGPGHLAINFMYAELFFRLYVFWVGHSKS